MSKLADMLPRTPWPDRLLAAAPPPRPSVCVCVCVVGGGTLTLTLLLRASDHTAQPWDLSNTAGTSPPFLPPLSSPLPDSSPPPPPRSPDSGRKLWYRGVEQRGEHFHFYLLRRLQDPPPFSPHPELLLISIKESAATSLLHCVCLRCCVIDIDMIWEGKEQKSLRPIHGDVFFFPSFCCFWVAGSAETTASVFRTGCHKMRGSVLCNKRHTTYSHSLHRRATVSSWTSQRGTQSEAVAQNKCFENGGGGGSVQGRLVTWSLLLRLFCAPHRRQ